jgi:hypothetical protein
MTGAGKLASFKAKNQAPFLIKWNFCTLFT